MEIMFFNTLSRKKEKFKEIDKGHVKIYTCGPTVYNTPHIGNYRAYLTSDILRRILKFNDFKIKHIMNVTDVDDKTIKNSQIEKISLKKFTEKYTKIFLSDLNSLNIETPEIMPKATEHIEEMVEMIKELIKNKIAYKGEDGSVYYSISKFKNYGKLAKIKLKELKTGARVKHDEYSKETINDFALWKAYDSADGEVFWETEIGKGRPGWHIECSAMSRKYLGDGFDIHTGGIDLIFPHHQNEIAQTEAITKKKFVNFWIHNEWLLVDGKKMSKSLNNFYTLKSLEEKGFSPIHFRYLNLQTHYRKPLNFTFEALEASKNALENLKRKVLELKKRPLSGKEIPKIYHENFLSAINDDLNTPKALQVFWNLLEEKNLASKDKLSLLEKWDSVLGLGISEFEEEKEEIPEEIKKLVSERETLRKSKKYAEADIIRERIKEKGFLIEDTEGKIKVTKIK